MSAMISELNRRFETLDAATRLIDLRERIAGRLVFTTSFGIEDQYLTHLIFENALAIDVVTLDTGRLFLETTALWSETEQRYGRRIRAVYPERVPLEALIADQGIDGQFLSQEARKACCAIRKVEPLRRALAGASVWITGLRADQSAHRSALEFITFDAGMELIKANPLLDYPRERLVDAVETAEIPINALHARGFPSIGCAPCTRAIKPGEDERAGRWWWETDKARECGLHIGPDGKPGPSQRPAGATL